MGLRVVIMSEKINLKRMCDHCYRVLPDDEMIFGFALVDDYGFKRGFKGHEECVQKMAEIIQEIYGKRGE